MRQVIVGVFPIGSFYCQLVLHEGGDGAFFMAPEAGALPRIKVGAYGEWCQVVSRLLHEATEMTMARLGFRFYASNDNSNGLDACVFMMTHAQFSMVEGDVAKFLVSAVPALSKEWSKKKWRSS